MKISLILTLLGPDRPGLVESVADVVTQHHGNWLESKMSRLSGYFAGILRVEVPEEDREALECDLFSLAAQGLQISIVTEDTPPAAVGPLLALEIIGHDQPGIVKRITSTLSAQGANVETLETSLESAPMAGHELFKTEGSISIPDDVHSAELIAALEDLGPDLSVTIS